MKKIRITKINNIIKNNINQNIFKKILNKRNNLFPELALPSKIKYNSFDDLPEISKKAPLSPLLSPKINFINLKKN